MGNSHLGWLAGELAERGFEVKRGETLVATLGKFKIHIRPEGLCWSSVDPSDAIVPRIPALIRSQRESVGRADGAGMYFDLHRGKEITIRFKPRLELDAWRFLRSEGVCALAPDEREVIAEISKASGGTIELITNFPKESSSAVRVGKKQFFRTPLKPEEVRETLQSVATKGHRASFIPPDGILKVRGLPRDWSPDLAELGEWFLFTPSRKKL